MVGREAVTSPTLLVSEEGAGDSGRNRRWPEFCLRFLAELPKMGQMEVTPRGGITSLPDLHIRRVDMFTFQRYLLVAALVMGLATAQVHAQGNNRPQVITNRVNLNPQIGPGLSLQQAAYNTAVLGRAYQQVPPYLFGYNPYPQNGFASGPSLPSGPLGASPYALSASPGYNPYTGSGSLGNSPYSLSTSGISPYGSLGGYGASFGYQDPTGAALQGYAALTAASGQAQVNIQQARILREQSRQMSYETTKRRLELERWYESTKPTPQQLRDQLAAAELTSARKEAPDNDITSGKALNVLLSSVQRSPSLNLGPNTPIDEENLKQINLAGAGTNGNVGMLKDVTKIVWPEALQESSYDKQRKRLNQNLVHAVTILKDGDPVPESTLKDIRADYKALNDRINDDDLTASQYIESRRFLNQLNQAIRALADKNVGKHFNKTWTAKGKNVAELVTHLTKEGLS